MKYITSKTGEKFKVEFPSVIENGKTDVIVWNMCYNKMHRLKVYYKPYKTLDDYMDNTECGYYCNVPFPGKETKRIFIYD